MMTYFLQVNLDKIFAYDLSLRIYRAIECIQVEESVIWDLVEH